MMDMIVRLLQHHLKVLKNAFNYGAEAITAPYAVLKQVFANPNIDKAVTDFNNDWYAVYGEGKGICDL